MDMDYNRPRRPNQETITYLRSLPLSVATAHEQVDAYLSSQQQDDDDNNLEFPSMFSAALSALGEVQNEIASLAGDEYASEMIEILAHICLPHSEWACRIFLHSISTYHVHLATHRFGSHVVQTALHQIVRLHQQQQQENKIIDLGRHEESPLDNDATTTTIPSLSTLLEGIVQELLPHGPQLAIHICASHVLRSLICVLGGVQLVSGDGPNSTNQGTTNNPLRRGRTKNKKKKKKNKSTTSDLHHHAGLVELIYCTFPNQIFRKLLWNLIRGIFALDDEHDLREYTTHPSASPLLIISLRVLTFCHCHNPTQWQTSSSLQQQRGGGDRQLGIRAPQPRFILHSPPHELANQILHFNKTNAASDVIFNMAQNTCASRVLETILHTCPDDLYANILQSQGLLISLSSDKNKDHDNDKNKEKKKNASKSLLKQYIEHDVANFCLQTILCTLRTPQQMETMLTQIEPFISNGYLVNRQNRRGSVLWRTMQVAASSSFVNNNNNDDDEMWKRQQQTSLFKAFSIGMGKTLFQKQQQKQDDDDEKEEESTSKKKRKKLRQKSLALALQDCIVPLVNIQPPRAAPDLDQDENDDESTFHKKNIAGRVAFNVEGCRTLHCMLHFSHASTHFVGDLLTGITQKLSVQELEWICKDGMASRCIMDAVLRDQQDDNIWKRAAQELLTKLEGRWAALAMDRVGHHSVIHLFHALSTDNKATLCMELSKAFHKLSGSSMGRSVMTSCYVSTLVESGQEAWEAQVRKSMQQRAWLEQELGGDENEKVKDGDVKVEENVDEDNKEEAVKKTKRKRKRKRKKSADGDAPAAEKKTKKMSVVESIFDTIEGAAPRQQEEGQ